MGRGCIHRHTHKGWYVAVVSGCLTQSQTILINSFLNYAP